jgi:hypothetical protein
MSAKSGERDSSGSDEIFKNRKRLIHDSLLR